MSLPFTCVDTVDRSGRSNGAIYTHGTVSANTADFLYLVVEGESAVRIYLGNTTSASADSAQQMQLNTSIGLNFSYFV